MSGVNSIGTVTPAMSITPKSQCSAPSAPATQLERPSDKLELSGLSQLFYTLKSNEIRADKVASIKAEIEAGTYDADSTKLDAAVAKMLDEVLE